MSTQFSSYCRYFSNQDTDGNVSLGHSHVKESQEPRIPLIRVDIDEKKRQQISSYYPDSSQTKPTFLAGSQETITHSCSPQRSSSKTEIRTTSAAVASSSMSYGLRNPYDFQNDEPIAMRQEHKATPYRMSNNSSADTLSTTATTNRHVPSSIRNSVHSTNEINEIRARIPTLSHDTKISKANQDMPTTRTAKSNESQTKISTNSDPIDATVKSKFIANETRLLMNCTYDSN
jgi:hypothetical protein